MDICGPLKTAKIGNNVVLVITDHFSKYTETFTLPHQKAARIAEVILNKQFHVHGEPQEKHSEKGPNFKSELIRQVCELHGLTKTRNSPYHTQGDGQDERFNKNMMNIVLFQKADEWDEVLPFTASAYNSTVHEITAFTPMRNLTILRHAFNTRSQQPDESFQAYMTVWRNMTSSYKFGIMRNELLKDRVVVRIKDEKTRNVQFAEPNLYLKQAVKV